MVYNRIEDGGLNLSEIIKLTESDYDDVKKYIYTNFWQCIEIAKIFDKNGLKNNISDKNSGDYYGYLDDDSNLQGIFLFTNNKRFFLNFMDDNVTKKVDLLKAIKHYKPEYMSGVTDNVSKIWKMFEKTVKRYKYNNSTYMVIDNERRFLDKFSADEDASIRSVNMIDAKANVNFLLEVEKEFKRNHLTINQLQDRIFKRLKSDEYLFVEIDNKVVAQAFVEDKINAFHQIGGVYTSPKYRGNSYGTNIVKELCKKIILSGNIPMLAVLVDNLAAISVYEKLLFNRKVDFTIIEIEF